MSDKFPKRLDYAPPEQLQRQHLTWRMTVLVVLILIAFVAFVATMLHFFPQGG